MQTRGRALFLCIFRTCAHQREEGGGEVWSTGNGTSRGHGPPARPSLRCAVDPSEAGGPRANSCGVFTLTVPVIAQKKSKLLQQDTRGRGYNECGNGLVLVVCDGAVREVRTGAGRDSNELTPEQSGEDEDRDVFTFCVGLVFIRCHCRERESEGGGDTMTCDNRSLLTTDPKI